MKLVYVYGKEGRMRFVSHLDLQRFLQRALNRTCLPIAFSKGFNPHPILSIAGALAMGYESDYEVFEVKIEGTVDKSTALETMKNALPEDMPIKQVIFRDDSFPSMMSLVKMADYEITPRDSLPELQSAASAFMRTESFMGLRKTKSGEKEIDVRKLCLKLEMQNGVILTRLMLTEQDTLKPDVLMHSLCTLAGIDDVSFRAKRTGLLGVDRYGAVKLITELQL